MSTPGMTMAQEAMRITCRPLRWKKLLRNCHPQIAPPPKSSGFVRLPASRSARWASRIRSRTRALTCSFAARCAKTRLQVIPASIWQNWTSRPAARPALRTCFEIGERHVLRQGRLAQQSTVDTTGRTGRRTPRHVVVVCRLPNAASSRGGLYSRTSKGYVSCAVLSSSWDLLCSAVCFGERDKWLLTMSRATHRIYRGEAQAGLLRVKARVEVFSICQRCWLTRHVQGETYEDAIENFVRPYCGSGISGDSGVCVGSIAAITVRRYRPPDLCDSPRGAAKSSLPDSKLRPYPPHGIATKLVVWTDSEQPCHARRDGDDPYGRGKLKYDSEKSCGFWNMAVALQRPSSPLACRLQHGCPNGKVDDCFNNSLLRPGASVVSCSRTVSRLAAGESSRLAARGCRCTSNPTAV